MQTYPKLNQPKLYLDRNGNAALEHGNSLTVVLTGAYTPTVLSFGASEGPLWRNAHASVRLTSKGELHLKAGDNRLVLQPVPPRSVIGIVQDDDGPIGFARTFDAWAYALRGTQVHWHPVRDMPTSAQLVGLR